MLCTFTAVAKTATTVGALITKIHCKSICLLSVAAEEKHVYEEIPPLRNLNFKLNSVYFTHSISFNMFISFRLICLKRETLQQ